jgi:outer membrane protein insertion porin family
MEPAWRVDRLSVIGQGCDASLHCEGRGLVKSIKAISSRSHLAAALLVGTSLSCLANPALAQDAAPQPAPEATTPAPPEAPKVVRSITVVGAQRLEPDTVISYMQLRVGQAYTSENLDDALRALIETELFTADTRIRDNNGDLIVEVRENPVINRIILEGNKRLKDDKINPEIKLAPRQIFTRSKVRADVARIIELYRRQGRFAAEVEPKIVQLDQNRVDLVFEISEGPKSKVRQINILGNERFGDGDLRGQMVTKQSRFYKFFSSSDIYDPDRLAYDQQKLRQFYFTHGYMDFRVISAVAELTPDKRDFIITYVVEEGERYKVGDVTVESELRDLPPDRIRSLVPLKKDDWYNAKTVEDTVTAISEAAGVLGYASADVRPQLKADKDAHVMSVQFQIAASPRQYVERIDINGNTHTRDKVIRREFRIAEGDAFNSIRVRRSRERIQSLGYFQDNLEVEQTEGSAPDRIVLTANVEEKSTGDLTVSAGFSSLERFLVNLSITERNFMGKGQILQAAVNYSSYSKSVVLGFTEPHIFDTDIGYGVRVYRQDYSSFRFTGNERDTTYKQVTTGGTATLTAQLSEYMGLQLRYRLDYDDITLDDIYFTDLDGTGPNPPVCDPIKAGRYLCDAIGARLSSVLGYTLVYDKLDNRLRPTRGHVITLSQDVAGLGGDTRHLRSVISASKYWPIFGNFVFSLSAQGGNIIGFNDEPDPFKDPVRIPDRFFLTEYPQSVRGFDIRGLGPRVIRTPTTFANEDDARSGTLTPAGDKNSIQDDALGGHNYYLGRAELEIPLGSAGRELGLRPSLFVDVGAVWGLRDPQLTSIKPTAFCLTGTTSSPIPSSGACPAGSTFTSTTGFGEIYAGDTPKPRVSVGFGVNWNSPFGPFRLDIAKALVKAEGDDTKLFNFSVGTAF